jgi:hypothetical protein
MEMIPKIAFGEVFCWWPPRTSVRRTCTIDDGQGRIRRIDIYVSKIALMDASRSTSTPSNEELEAMAKRLWDKRIYPVVKQRIMDGQFAPDGTLQVTTAEIGR